jgi:hypothetical protein
VWLGQGMVVRNSRTGPVDPLADPIGHLVVALRRIPHTAGRPGLSYVDKAGAGQTEQKCAQPAPGTGASRPRRFCAVGEGGA